MLGYLLRTVGVAARARFVGPRTLSSRFHGRVRLSEIDLNLHMNQAVYAQVFELGRADWVVRSGLWTRVRGQRINPVVAQQNLVYRRELKPLQRYVIDTRATAIEGRLLLVESHLIVGDKVHAKNVVKLIFVGPEGVLAPEEMPPLVDDFLCAALQVSDWTVPSPTDSQDDRAGSAPVK